MLPTKEEAFALLKESYTMNPGPGRITPLSLPNVPIKSQPIALI